MKSKKSSFKNGFFSHFPKTLIFFIGIGTFIRFMNLGNIILYWDEPLHCIRIASQPLSFVLARNDGSAFFAVLVHFLIGLGKLEIMARLASAFFGVLTIAIVYFLGKELISKRAGIIAALFITFSPMLIHYSQYSRMYSSYTFLSLLTVYFFLKAVTHEKAKYWMGYAGAMVINIYNHIFGLFVIPGFGLFSLGIWFKKKAWKKFKFNKLFEQKPLVHFICWTFAALVVAAILYIPDISLKDYIQISINRVSQVKQSGGASLSLLGDVLAEQFKASSQFFLFIFLILVIIGFFSVLKKKSKECLFVLIYIFIPFLIFIAIDPNKVAVLSAGRYFLFFLPLLYIFMGQGILTVVNILGGFFEKLKLQTIWKKTGQFALICLILFAIIGFGFDLKSYYTNFWRLGSVKLERDVIQCFKSNLKKDAFILIAEPPVSSMVLAINPLTKDLTLSQIEHTIREDHVVNKNENPVMMMSTLPNWLKYYAPRKIDFWVISKPIKNINSESLNLISAKIDGKVFVVKKRLILAFLNKNISLKHKIDQALEILELFDFSQSGQRDRLYLSSRNRFFEGDFDSGIRQLYKALEYEVINTQVGFHNKTFFIRMLDKVFGLNKKKLIDLHERRFKEAIAHLLLFQGDDLRKKNDKEKAFLAYKTCAQLSPTYHEQLSIRLGFMANSLMRENLIKQSIPLYQKAVELDAGRFDLKFMLAEALSLAGQESSGTDQYQQIFKTEELSEKVKSALKNTDPIVLIWKKNNQWFILFRSYTRGILDGTIYSSKKLTGVKESLFVKKDKLSVLSKKIKIDISANKGIVKTLTFRSSKNAKLTFNFSINGKKNPGSIFILHEDTSPEKNPFILK